MNGVHDLGGMHGFGPVDRHEDTLRFEHEWEPVLVAIQAALEGTVTNIAEFRHAIERMDPARYLGGSYFERWLDGMTRSCVEKGVFSEAEFEVRAADPGPSTMQPADRSAATSQRRRPDGFRRTPASPARFAAGDHVLTRNDHPPGHTRLARFARGHRGVIAAHHGCMVFPDTNAHGLGEQPQHLYSVRFDARELWGPAAPAGDCVFIDLFEPYLLAGC